jgi:hypothetical protein
MTERVCAACGTRGAGRFCSECGAPLADARVPVREALREDAADAICFDSRLAVTLRDRSFWCRQHCWCPA